MSYRYTQLFKQLFSCFTVLLFVFPNNSKAQNVRLMLDTHQVVVGQLFTATLQATFPSDNIQLPIYQDTLVKKIDILKQENDTLLNEQGFIFITTLSLMVFDTGYFLIPPQAIVYQDSTYLSNPELIRVNFELIQANEPIKTITQNWETPFIFDEIKQILWYILIGFILLALLIFVVWFALKKIKLKSAAVVPSIHPYDWHLMEIKKIDQAAIWKTGNVKGHHSDVSFILRSLLQEIYHFPCKESITADIVAQLKLKEINPEQLNTIKAVLQFADLAKYAKEIGLEHQHTSAVELLYDLVEKIKPISVTTQEESNG